MTRRLCGVEEDVVRAICSPDHYNPKTKTISPSLFCGSDTTSLSRLKVLPLEDHWDLFKKYVQKPHRRLEMFGEIRVEAIQDIGRGYKIGPPGKEVPHPVVLTVEEAPEEWNPAHAEIPQKISRGLANKILPVLKLHQSD